METSIHIGRPRHACMHTCTFAHSYMHAYISVEHNDEAETKHVIHCVYAVLFQ